MALTATTMKMTISTSGRIRQLIDSSDGTPKIAPSDISNLEEELEEVLARIATKPSASDAESEFEELIQLHELLAVLLFKFRVELTERQEKVVRVFDRWDVEETRTHFYEDLVGGRI